MQNLWKRALLAKFYPERPSGKRAFFCQILQRAASDYQTLISFGLFFKERLVKFFTKCICQQPDNSDIYLETCYELSSSGGIIPSGEQTSEVGWSKSVRTLWLKSYFEKHKIKVFAIYLINLFNLFHHISNNLVHNQIHMWPRWITKMIMRMFPNHMDLKTMSPVAVTYDLILETIY